MFNLSLDWQNDITAIINAESVKEHLELVLQRLNYSAPAAVEVKVVDAATIQKLNQQFLDHDYPTDVLSFPSGLTDQTTLGSIVIAEPIANEQAQQAGISLQDEVNMLAGHGLLHLLGYHHK